MSEQKKGKIDFDNIKQVIDHHKKEIQDLYLQDQMPWVIGYSGGKDSTAITQLIWNALKDLPKEKRHKDVWVITTDTLVENPIVAQWVNYSLEIMEKNAQKENLPIYTKLLTPPAKDSFWTNLIGKGYPAPRHGFRWCTNRLKIDPVSAFVETFKEDDKQVIIVIGARSAESAARSSVLKKRESTGTRKNLSQHNSMSNALVYAPIKDWDNDDVWLYLMEHKNPWGINNKDLFDMYRGATQDKECPLVIDTTTPSCGSSRFGCWVCTLVEKDKSMSAMIQNDKEKEWMAPLLKFRNELDFRSDEINTDRDKRDFRRLSGNVVWMSDKDREVPGPYTQDARKDFLTKLLQTQKEIQENPKSPPEVKDINLIQLEELHEIRRIWVLEKHETEDLLPIIYENVLGKVFPKQLLDDRQPFGKEELELLKEIIGDDDLHFELCRSLLSVERQHSINDTKKKLLNDLKEQFKRSYYENVEDARSSAKKLSTISDIKKNIQQKSFDLDSLKDAADIAKKEVS
ncbi:DNA phosphorothioation system sulfurtransferase DndC [Alphaproteobacteria bacterium]|nr:DNA phosphorothioation system sulfurtransferase DndC [Alphaproteobacteria bacterium]